MEKLELVGQMKDCKNIMISTTKFMMTGKNAVMILLVGSKIICKKITILMHQLKKAEKIVRMPTVCVQSMTSNILLLFNSKR